MSAYLEQKPPSSNGHAAVRAGTFAAEKPSLSRVTVTAPITVEGSRMIRRLAPLLAVILLAAPPAALAASRDVADLKAGTYAVDKRHTIVIAKVMPLGHPLY